MQRTILIFTALVFVLEFYVFQAFKTIVSQPWMRAAYWLVTVGVYMFFVYQAFTFSRGDADQHKVQLMAVIFLAFMVPKIFAAVFLFVEDLLRFVHFAAARAHGKSDFPGRRRFISILSLGGLALFAGLVLDGVIFGKYRHTARRVKVKIKNLPESFKGYKIVQISDVHSGSFFHPEKLQPAIDLINRQNADLVLFTGDMVNNVSQEFVPFVNLFKTIRAKDGKFSVLGNHDYGSYVEWKSSADKMANLQNLIHLQQEAGFKMLLNEHTAIEKNGEQLFIIGVENWGEKPFPQFGDLDKATAGIPASAAKILMSHDPTHFDAVVKHHPSDVALTLSGHTHGMQFGIDLKNWRWSPVQFRYKKWADLYESAGKYLYVNRGFGVIGYPGRVGIKPEITVFELG